MKRGEQPLSDHVAPLELAVRSGSESAVVFADSTEGPGHAIKLIDVATGSVSNVAQGMYPQLGPNDEVSFCDEHSELIVLALGDPKHSATAPIRPFGCAAVGWSPTGALAAIVAEGAGSSVEIRGASGGDFVRLPLSETVRGASALSWSSDSASIAFGMLRQVAIVDARTGVVRRIEYDGIPQFAPTEANLVAILDTARQTPALAIFEGGTKLAEREFSDSAPASFAWSPDSQWIATSEDRQIRVWNWRTNESLVIATSGVGGFVPGIAWLP